MFFYFQNCRTPSARESGACALLYPLLTLLCSGALLTAPSGMDPVEGQQFNSWVDCKNFLLAWDRSKNVVLTTYWRKRGGEVVSEMQQKWKTKEEEGGTP